MCVCASSHIWTRLGPGAVAPRWRVAVIRWHISPLSGSGADSSRFRSYD
jgi:hypothetical protein